ncbi:hypothetical protein M011DRAFT_476143 [Sporormia fimetaria CBS 119925]|uniref:Uncharacterized protein n=1 Tax=Sporormia fimetaria CBS 119925 TaxID=1340428 RepID=A0A6A6VGB1_9PLEO|nr:hypothetical protein M011DRAFT_476143 [Sporormia fimetaria CBS 119925]
MQEDNIKSIFVKEKKRIGKVIGDIDNALPNHPRKDQIDSSTDYKTFEAWKPLGLEKKWHTYMDEVFVKAKSKGTDFVETNIQRLKDEFTDKKKIEEQKEKGTDTDDEKKKKAEKRKQQEEMKKIIEKLEASWDSVKNWQRP